MGCMVLVDGWNHYVAAKRCFGHDVARRFPIDRLAAHLAHVAGVGPVSEVIVVMALPDRNRPEEEPEFHAWRSKFRKLANVGVSHDKARFSYLDATCSKCHTLLSRDVACTECGERSRVDNRRKEKGADVQIAVRAVDATWNQTYSSLILLSQDSDFGPLVRRVREIHRTQARTYRLFSAFPVCTSPDHEHRSVPGMQALSFGADVYAELAARPRRNPLADH